MEKEDIDDIILKWAYERGNEDGYIVPNREGRMVALGNLFTILREKGYVADDVRMYARRIKAWCYPCPGYKGSNEKKKNWIAAADKDYEKAWTTYMIPGTILSDRVEPLPSAELVTPAVAEFVRAAPPLDRTQFENKESGAAPYAPDKDICDLLEVPEDHRG